MQGRSLGLVRLFLFHPIVFAAGFGFSFLELDSRWFEVGNVYALYIISTPYPHRQVILATLVFADI